MSRFTVAVAVAAVLSVACRDQQPLQSRPMTGPAFLISDGAHTSGNPDFFFLPPLVSSPVGTTNYDAGKFNPRLVPLVEVCRLQADPRVDPTTDCMSGPLVLPPTPMTLSSSNEHYAFNWDTQSAGLSDDGFYRVLVVGALHSTPLGFLDLDPVSGGMKNLKSGEVVQFQDGRNLPIRVRIEEGAFGSTNDDHVEQTVGNVATIVTTNTGFAGASFPDNWLPPAAVRAGITQVVVIIERLPVNDGDPQTSCFGSNLLELQGCYRFRTDPDLHQFGPFNVPEGATFDQQVIAGVCFEEPQFEHTDAPFQLHRQEEGVEFARPVALPSAPANFLSCGNFTAALPAASSGSVWHLVDNGLRALGRGIAHLVTPQRLYAVDEGAGGSTGFFSRFGWARPASMTKTARTDLQTATAGTAVPVDPEVCLTTTHHSSGPLGDAAVTFSVAPGNGTIGGGSSVVVNTDAKTGCAHAQWVLSPTAGTNALTVTAQADGSPQTFTATGTAGVAIASLDVATTTLTIGGLDVSYSAVIANGTGTTLSVVFIQAYIDQGAASRAAGGSDVTCGPSVGDLPPGPCNFQFGLGASNSSAGTGTLVPGSATARFELRRFDRATNTETLLDTRTVAVTLVP